MMREDYYKKLGWSKSPFIKSTSLDIPIIERVQEYERVCESIGGWDRIMVLTAPIGYGKTTFMNQLMIKKPRGVRYVIPFNAYEPIEVVMKKIRNELPLMKRLFLKTDKTAFGEEIQGSLGKEKMLLVFDEAQDYEEDLFRWLRILNDRADNIFMIFLGIYGLEDKISAETSFRDRKSKSIRLQAFEIEDLEEMVRERIQWAGGEGIEPFSEKGLRRLCESCNRVPRKLLENGQKVIEEASKAEKEQIGVDFVEGIVGGATLTETKKDQKENELIQTVKMDFIYDLSPTQRDIVDSLMKHESLSVSELSQALDKDIRSLGSLIRKLRGLDKKEVGRKPNVPYPIIVRAGKEVRNGRLQYVYRISDNVRRLLAKK